MIGITTGPQPHANDWERQNQADSVDQIGSPSPPGVSGVLSSAAWVPRVQPLPYNMAARDWLRDRPDCAAAAKVNFITRCRPEARRRELVA